MHLFPECVQYPAHRRVARRWYGPQMHGTSLGRVTVAVRPGHGAVVAAGAVVFHDKNHRKSAEKMEETARCDAGFEPLYAQTRKCDRQADDWNGKHGEGVDGTGLFFVFGVVVQRRRGGLITTRGIRRPFPTPTTTRRRHALTDPPSPHTAALSLLLQRMLLLSLLSSTSTSTTTTTTTSVSL